LTVAIMAPIVALAFTVHFSIATVSAIYFVLVIAGVVSLVERAGSRVSGSSSARPIGSKSR
jgi:uncharacterized ion transporter superfamily protein YfcC